MTTSAFGPRPRDLALEWRPGTPIHGDHVAYFYHASDSLLEALCNFIGPALDGGNGAIVVATEGHREGLERKLAARGFGIQAAKNEGRYIAIDASQLLSSIMMDGIPDAAIFEEKIGGMIAEIRALGTNTRKRVVIFGEMVSLLWTEGKTEAAIRLEVLWNQLGKKYDFSLRCAYPMGICYEEESAQSLLRVCAEHSAIMLDDKNNSLVGGESNRALRRSEERFRMMVDAVRDYAIFMLDEQGYISTWNTGAERIKGYSASEIIGRHFSIFYPEEDIKARKPQRELEIANQEGRLEDEGWRLRKDGSRFWANVIISALRDDSGKLVGFAKVTRDYTEKLKTNEALQKEIAERREAQKKLYESEKSLRQLSLRLLQTQDEERRRIGRDLHDSVGQYLVALKMRVDSLKSEAQRNRRENVPQLTECIQLAEEAIKEVRTISYLLYPPMLEELGLRSAIPWYLDGFTKRSGIKTSFEASPEFDRIPVDLELALFRVLQESLTNVHRHSGSSTATIKLVVKDHNVVLQVIDQGKGSEGKNWEDRTQDWMGSFGVGLRGMNERMHQLGGSMELRSSQQGTTITATVPLPDSVTGDHGEEQHA